MGKTCVKCGKELGWFGSTQSWLDSYPELIGKKLCKQCFKELYEQANNERDRRCIKCGQIKEYRGITYPGYEGKIVCQDCYEEEKAGFPTEKLFKDALEQCKRIVVINDASLSTDDIGQHVLFYSRVAEKFGYVYKSETHVLDSTDITQAPTFTSSMIFEKVIPTANETKFVNCTHCTTRFDANQYFKCPQCGAPTT